jgi:hypothetical protein
LVLNPSVSSSIRLEHGRALLPGDAPEATSDADLPGSDMSPVQFEIFNRNATRVVKTSETWAIEVVNGAGLPADAQTVARKFNF